jgi:hypothetical protein
MMPARLAIASLAIFLFATSGARAASPPAVDPACAAPPARATLPATAFAGCARQWVALSREAPDRVPAATLQALVDETFMRSIPAADPAYVEAIEASVDELERRKLAEPSDRGLLVVTLQLNDRYDEAMRRQPPERTLYTSAFPRRVPAPRPRAAGALQAWSWDVQADTLTERTVDLAHGARVVVWSAPSCHFCEQAATDIDADPQLAKTLAAHALWVQRPLGGLEREAMQAWTARHPAAPIDVVSDPAGWPMPKAYGTPTFLFLQDGKVVTQVSGWPPDHDARIRQALRAIGLEPGQ